MRETEILARLRIMAEKLRRDRQVIRGIGDDCAILRPKPGFDFAFTTDFVLEGRHFTLDSHSAGDVGHKALARSLSDLAAMGSEPVFCLVSLGVPRELADKWTRQFFERLLKLAAEYKITLAGGDLAKFDRVIVDVICCGTVPQGKALMRSGAKPGDRICVTGRLGESAAGLRTRRGHAWSRHLRPQPRILAGIALRKLGVLAAMDLSDGLALDLRRMCQESRIGAELSGEIPVAPGATLEDALYGGEDYELLFAAPPAMKLPELVDSVPITVIGEFIRSKRGTVSFRGKRLEHGGFDHFA